MTAKIEDLTQVVSSYERLKAEHQAPTNVMMLLIWCLRLKN